MKTFTTQEFDAFLTAQFLTQEDKAKLQQYKLLDEVQEARNALSEAAYYRNFFKTDEAKSWYLRSRYGPLPADQDPLIELRKQRAVEAEIERKKRLEEEKTAKLQIKTYLQKQKEAAEQAIFDNLPEYERAYRLQQKAHIDQEKTNKQQKIWEGLPEDVRANWDNIPEYEQEGMLAQQRRRIEMENEPVTYCSLPVTYDDWMATVCPTAILTILASVVSYCLYAVYKKCTNPLIR